MTAAHVNGSCKIEGCGSPVLARGLCQKHYCRWQKTGDPLACKFEKKLQKCNVDGCDSLEVSRKLCGLHYQRWRKSGDALLLTASLKERPCTAAGCDEKQLAKGYCAFHYHKFRWHGQTFAGRPRNKRRRGEGTFNNGYHFTTVTREGSRRMIGTHRLVMEKKLGRSLRPNENVHHINGRRSDNRPENLELWVKSQPSGQRPCDLVSWAWDVIALYGAEVIQNVPLVSQELIDRVYAIPDPKAR